MKKTYAGFVAIIGRPNSGKSTLLNAVLGTELSIVTRKAQTTRERVLGILSEKTAQIVFVDTPGIHQAKEGGINAYMVHEAAQALDGPSAIWYVVDPTSMLFHEEAVISLLKKTSAPIFLLINKLDWKENAIFEQELAKRLEELKFNVSAVLKISAKKKKGLTELMDATWKLIPESPFYYPDEDQLSDRPTKFFVAEKIREQLYLQLGEELPYSCAVQIESYKEDSVPPRIEAIIHVERDSQKGMVVGKGGSKIKDIGTAARATIEEFLGEKIFLGLKVAVLKEWTRDAEALKRMGYNLPKTKKNK